MMWKLGLIFAFVELVMMANAIVNHRLWWSLFTAFMAVGCFIGARMELKEEASAD